MAVKTSTIVAIIAISVTLALAFHGITYGYGHLNSRMETAEIQIERNRLLHVESLKLLNTLSNNQDRLKQSLEQFLVDQKKKGSFQGE